MPNLAIEKNKTCGRELKEHEIEGLRMVKEVQIPARFDQRPKKSLESEHLFLFVNQSKSICLNLSDYSLISSSHIGAPCDEHYAVQNLRSPASAK